MAKAAKSIKLSFEEAVTRLSEIVSELEQERVGLDRSMALFAEGRTLADLCKDQLAEAEEKVQSLLKDNDAFVIESGLRDSIGNEIA